MIRLLTIACFVVLALVPLEALPGAPAGAAASATLVEAALAPETTNDGKSVMVPDAGQAFLWVTARMDAAATVDLTKVSVASGATTFPLLGVSLWDGDPVKFSMIAPVHLKSGKLSDPLEESSSAGSIAFVFTPGKTATLEVITPPQSFCLLFAVPKAFKAGKVAGLGATELPLPALAASKP